MSPRYSKYGDTRRHKREVRVTGKCWCCGADYCTETSRERAKYPHLLKCCECKGEVTVFGVYAL